MLLLFIPLFAHPCRDVRLDKTGPMSKIPVYDQDSFGSCYAYTASQLIDAYRFTKNPNATGFTSPISLSVNYSYNYNTFGLGKDSGGSVEEAILAARRTETCEKSITDKILAKQSEKEFYERFIAYFHANADELDKRSLYASTKAYLNGEYTKGVNNLHCNLTNSALPASLIPSLEVIEESMGDIGINEAYFLHKLLGHICANAKVNLEGFPKPTHEFVQHQQWTPQVRALKSQAVFDNLLSKPNPQPIGIGFCSKVFKSSWTGITSEQAKTNNYNNQNCASHAAIIVGSRKAANGKCDYLIKNSWGIGCKKYQIFGLDPSITCEEATGQLWVSGDKIGTSITSVTTF